MTMNWKGFGKKLSWPEWRDSPEIYLQELKKSHEISVRIDGDPAKNLDPTSTSYQAEVLPLEPVSSV
jgi:hypothetical protein